MRLKLDENLSRHLKPRLQDLGYDVCTAGDEGLLSQPDEIVANAAKNEGRIVLTLDSDFANLKKYPPGSHPGIFLFRPPSLGILAIHSFVEEFLRVGKLEDLRGCLTIIEPGRIRIRRPDPFESESGDD